MPIGITSIDIELLRCQDDEMYVVQQGTTLVYKKRQVDRTSTNNFMSRMLTRQNEPI